MKYFDINEIENEIKSVAPAKKPHFNNSHVKLTQQQYQLTRHAKHIYFINIQIHDRKIDNRERKKIQQNKTKIKTKEMRYRAIKNTPKLETVINNNGFPCQANHSKSCYLMNV